MAFTWGRVHCLSKKGKKRIMEKRGGRVPRSGGEGANWALKRPPEGEKHSFNSKKRFVRRREG